MKKSISLILASILVLSSFVSCRDNSKTQVTETTENTEITEFKEENTVTDIVLSDDKILVNGEKISQDSTHSVFAANDIIYYEEGHDFTYGEGTENDAHSKDEADAHTVVHITKPGQYTLSGSLSKGQVAVDLGENADENPEAIVTLVLKGVDITCTVAPAIIFYSVYECSSSDSESATKDVDTSCAGANVIIADGSENTVNGSYVARIYKSDSVVLNEDGTEVADAKKLHKYDGAFYSKMSMNVSGGESGVLNINAENEGLDSELHLTINGGNINIVSGNDGINTNEDYISVTTINGGNLNILINGETGEGDGIDSNGWLVINGGNVKAQACAFSGDAGIDSDMGIHINGGYVFATGNMLDRISESTQTFAVFSFAGSQEGNTYTLKNSENEVIFEEEVKNNFTYMIISGSHLEAGDYTFWKGDIQMEGANSENMNIVPGNGETLPEGLERPEMPGGMEIPEGMERPEIPDGMEIPEGMERPEIPGDMEIPEGMERPEGGRNPGGAFNGQEITDLLTVFTIIEGGNHFQSVRACE